MFIYRIVSIFICIIITCKVLLWQKDTYMITLYGCQSWTLSKEMEKRNESFEFKYYRQMLWIPYTAHITNKSIKDQKNAAIVTLERLLKIVKKRKLQWCGHLVGQDNSLAAMIMEGIVDGKRRRGRTEKQWMDKIEEWAMLESDDIMQKARD